ncbi:transposase [Nodularia sp. LEGE 06071]|uniref:RNA-guided endonuclease TnpB family protein n=2 Tax=Nodularia TaxID=159191 RepID=UPI00187E9CD2|nr:transposase [Nodularia sp. LEGE 06071]MCC2691057.1 transposase [Nodularia sp. LEGE 04288]
MLTMNYRYRIYPTITQEQTLLEWMDICRVAYNYGLREIKDWCNSRKCMVDRCSISHEYIIAADVPFPSEVRQLNALPKAKKVFPRLGEVPSQVLQQTLKQLHRAWEGFQKVGHGFPRFKKFGQFKSLLFPQFQQNPVQGVHIALPKLGLIRVNLHRPIKSGFVVKQVRIINKANVWYASINIQCDVNVPSPMPHGHPIGVDVGLEKFLATSDGVLVKSPKFLKVMQSQLKLLQRRLSRKKKRSKNYEKQRIKVARLHHRIDNTRKDYHFKQAHALCDAGDMVFMEDLDYRTLAKGMLGLQMLDAGFGQFRTITKYVCWKRGKFFAEVSARGTSIECPECGAEVRKDLSVRVHHCPSCNYTTDRDVASGQVIRNRGIKLISTDGQSGIQNAYADGLPGIEEIQSRSKSKTRKTRLERRPKEATRKTKK